MNVTHYAEFLPNILYLISAALFVVIIFRKLKLSPVLGYLVAGAFIGDHSLQIVNYEDISSFSEFGVVFLLFAIGLELTFERLKLMHKYVFGFGSLQVISTASIIAIFVILVYQDFNAAIIIGGGLALSSTAIVLQVIAETRTQSTQVGRLGLAILLLQDFAVVPLLVIVPLLTKDPSSMLVALSLSFVKAILALTLIFIVGRLFLRPLFNLITSPNMAQNNELFIAATIFIALFAAWGTEYLGLSLALGAFVAGILVAETEFQVRAEESIAPFKALLLGLFFMAVGMTIDIQFIANNLSKILLMTFALIVVKAIIIIILCILFGFSLGVAIHSGLLLAQGGEFSFILFRLGVEKGVLTKEGGEILMMVVTITMAMTPLLASLGAMIAKKIDIRPEYSPIEYIKKSARDLNHHVIIAGFGLVGKMVARVLEAENIHYIIIDISGELVDEERKNNYAIFKGDVTNLPTLEAAGLERAQSIIIAIDNMVTVKKCLKTLSTNFPEVSVVVRAPDLKNADNLFEAGATIIVPEDYETGLQLGGAVLKSVGISEYEISRIKNQFRASNYVLAKINDKIEK